MLYKLNPAITEQELRDYGFTDWSNGHWYYCKTINKYKPNISFNLDILKSDYNHIEIETIDDFIGRKYDFEYLIAINHHNRVAKKIKKEYDKMVKKLLKDKILLEVN